jgi:hypothetical protein
MDTLMSSAFATTGAAIITAVANNPISFFFIRLSSLFVPGLPN